MAIILKNSTCFDDKYEFVLNMDDLQQSYESGILIVEKLNEEEEYLISIPIIETNILIKKDKKTLYAISIEMPHSYDNKFKPNGKCFNNKNSNNSYKISKKSFSSFNKKTISKACELVVERNLCEQNKYFLILISSFNLPISSKISNFNTKDLNEYNSFNNASNQKFCLILFLYSIFLFFVF